MNFLEVGLEYMKLECFKLEYMSPILYMGLIALPFLFKNTLFSKTLANYEDVTMVFVNINRLPLSTENNENYSVTCNPYYDESRVHLEIYLENEDDYNMIGVLNYDIFQKQTVNPDQLEKTIFELRDFCDHCMDKLNRKPFIMVNTNDPTYEIFLNEYDIPNVINLKRMYGFFNTDDATIPALTPITMLNEIVTKKYITIESPTRNKTEFMIKLLESW